MRPSAIAGRRPRRVRPLAALAAVALLAALAAGCRGSSGESDERLVLTPPEGDVVPIAVSSELTVGQNRFVLGLQDRDNNLILDADVHLRFFSLEDGETTLESETDALPVVIAEPSAHEHEDGTPHANTGNEVGVYVAHVEFAAPGRRVVEVSAIVEGEEEAPAQLQFDVLGEASSPAVGAPAPRSRQPTLRDVHDISEIDSSIPPRPQMHELTIAEAIESGRPAVVAFATPAFCQSRVCGPLMDAVVDPLFERYGDRVNFIHVEPFDLERARQGELIPVPTMEEWGLQTEPWLFVIDREGRVAGKFEAIVAFEEAEPLLRQVLGESSG